MSDSADNSESAWRRFWEIAKIPIAFSAGGAALLTYFGWAYMAAEARTWGIDASYLRLSRTEYVLRSVNAVQLPLGVGLALSMAVLMTWKPFSRWLHGGDGRIERFATWSRRVGAALIAVGSVALVATGLDDSLFAGLSLAGGAILLVGGLHLDPGTPATGLLAVSVLIGLVGLFSATRVYAGMLGERFAHEHARAVPELADVLIYSDQPLWLLPVLGTSAVSIDRSGESPIYRYRCLSLLQRVGDTLLLVPFGYSTDRRHTVVYAVDATQVRVDFDDRRRQRGETRQPCP